MANEKQNPIPVQGSLGLLANGAKGLRAWREAKKKAQEKPEKTGTQND
jgi:hypothetical protein